MTLTYGPNTPQINAIIEVVKGLHGEQGRLTSDYSDAYVLAIAHAEVTANIFDRNAAFDSLSKTAIKSDFYRSENKEARRTVWCAILAHLAQPYIGATFTQEMHDLLLKPWEEFMTNRNGAGK